MSNQLPVPFTPGPWVCQPSSHPDVGTLIKPIPGQVVAVVERLPNEASNARLIAAAPAMYEMLRDLREAWLDDRIHSDVWGILTGDALATLLEGVES